MREWSFYPTLGIQSYSQLMIGVSNHLLSIIFRFHYHPQKVIGCLGLLITCNLGSHLAFLYIFQMPSSSSPSAVNVSRWGDRVKRMHLLNWPRCQGDFCFFNPKRIHFFLPLNKCGRRSSFEDLLKKKTPRNCDTYTSRFFFIPSIWEGPWGF